jgi:hypothetical protein
MKTQKGILLSLVLSISIIGQSQISKTISCTAGNLDALLGGSKTVVTNLTITGSIDARDFKCMSTIMTSLLDLDISAVTIKSYTGSGGTHVDNNNVYLANEIPDYAFQVNSPSILRSIILPNSLTSIGNYAFWYHKELLSITIPSSVISIGKDAFRGTSLTDISLPNGLKTIVSGAFSGSLIESIIIPNTVTAFGVNTYMYNVGVFSYCSKLVNVTLPNSIISIPFETFLNCKALRNIEVPNSVNYIGDKAFANCTSLTDIKIPNSVISLGRSAFLNCTGLESIVIGSNVSTIYELAFDGCTSLSSITVCNKTPIDFTKNLDVFRGVNKATCTLYVPSGSKIDYQTNVVWMDFKNIVETTTGISSPSMPTIAFSPNPTTDSFTLNGLEELATVILMDLNGKVLLTRQVNNTETVSLKGLLKGIYIAKVSTSKGTIQQKLIKQ